MDYSSSCQCGVVRVNLTLPNTLEDYEPRECDCEFCRLHNITYISDPDGCLSIEAAGTLKQSKQGSGQATFWQCSSCNQMVAVTHDLVGELKGAVNGQLFSKQYKLGKSVAVSPRLLSPSEKRDRWKTAWLQVKFSP